MELLSHKCKINRFSPIYNWPLAVDVLRLDEVHPVVSGNKWFKLKDYLQEARAQNKKTLITFGGAYSNHIVAMAAAAKMKSFNSIGIIRGQEPDVLSHTIEEARKYGMELFFVSREDYKRKLIPSAVYNRYNVEETYLIPEGGYGQQGMRGAKDILQQTDASFYSHIVLAVGTGTTIAGIIAASTAYQNIIGVSALKNNFSLQQEIEQLLPEAKRKSFTLMHDYHFRGYAKYTNELILFMNELYTTTSIPTDFVYTAKTFFAVFDLVKKNYFTSSDKVLLIHTGGLQGNLSLPKGTLIYG